MLSTIVVWCYIFAIGSFYGLMMNKILIQVFHTNEKIPAPLTIFNGLILVTWLLTILHLFIPIGIFAHVLLITGAVIFSFFNRSLLIEEIRHLLIQIPRIQPLVVLLFSLIAFYILVLTVSPIIHSDTGLYHVPSIHWIEIYRIIPGIGNLYGTYAYNSLFFVLSAFFRLQFLHIQPIYALNGFLGLLFTAFCIELMYFHQRHESTSFIAIAAGLFLTMPQFAMGYYYPSMSPDPAVMILTWFVLILFIQKQEQPAPYRFDLRAGIIVLYAILAFTWKISAAPLILLPAFLIFAAAIRKKIRPLIASACLAVIFLLPWFIRSYISSGYLIYPLHQVDLFNPDWKVPVEQARADEEVIGIWGRERYKINYQEILNLSLAEWMPFWLNRTSPWGYEDIIAAAFPLAEFFFIGSLIYTWKRKQPWILTWAYLVILLGSVFWFFTAPVPRYGMGFLFPLLLLPASQVLNWLAGLQKGRTVGLIIAAGLTAALLMYFASQDPLDFNDIHRRTLLFQPGYEELQLDSTIVDGQKVYFADPTNGYCYDFNPCSPLPPPFRWILRGDTIESGFRSR